MEVAPKKQTSTTESLKGKSKSFLLGEEKDLMAVCMTKIDELRWGRRGLF